MIQQLTGLAIAGLILTICIRRVQKQSNSQIITEITVALSLSIVASYIFYFINIYQPEIKRQKECYEDVASALAKIEYNIISVCDTFNIPLTTPTGSDYNALIYKKKAQSLSLFTPLNMGANTTLDSAIALALSGSKDLLEEASKVGVTLSPRQRAFLDKLNTTIPKNYYKISFYDTKNTSAFHLGNLITTFNAFKSSYLHAIHIQNIFPSELVKLEKEYKEKLISDHLTLHRRVNKEYEARMKDAKRATTQQFSMNQ
jgi:hypothetical protein